MRRGGDRPDDVRCRLAGAIEARREELVALTRELVAIPTENPPGRASAAGAALLADRLRALGIAHRVVEAPGAGDAPRSCLLGSHGAGGRALYFHGHYDVVPAASPAQFRPERREGRLFGRGTADMKGGLAAMIYAVLALREAGCDLRGRVGLTIVPDEETGGALGARYLAAAGLLGTDGVGMLTPEPTSGVIWNASRGALSLRVTVRGRAAHVGQHYLGVNAFEGMLVVAERLRTLGAEVAGRETAFAVDPAGGAAARRSILLLGGRCEGGDNFNVVPATCSFTVDRRINPEEDLAVEKARLLDLFARLREEGIDLEVEILQEGAAAGVSVDDPVARALAASVVEVTGRAPAFTMCPGLLEIRFYAARGVPAYAYGPGLLEVAHGPDEFVGEDELASCALVYALTAARLLAA